MSRLTVTLIDVGWGDSILIESEDNQGIIEYALVDSNDSAYYKSSFIFLKRFFERREINLPEDKPVFKYLILSHAHTDHGQGLKHIASQFGTEYFFYPKAKNWSGLATLLRFSNRSSNVGHAEALNSTKHLDNLCDTELSVLWPRYQDEPSDNENNNSIVLNLRLGNVSVLLTGDAEQEVWDQIRDLIPQDVLVFKVPHHGSINGAFDHNHNPCWLHSLSPSASLAISAHIRPFNHPHQQVIELIDNAPNECFRTDWHYHVSFTTDGNDISVKYSH